MALPIWLYGLKNQMFSKQCEESFVSRSLSFPTFSLPAAELYFFISDKKNASMEMAVLFSMQWNIFLKSEVTRSTEQRNPRWH